MYLAYRLDVFQSVILKRLRPVGDIFSGYITGLTHPDVLSFNREPISLAIMFSFSTKLYISILAISAIQYWLSLRFKNFIAAIGIGLGLFIAGLLLMEWPKTIYYPYSYTGLTYFKDLRKGITGTSKHEIYSLFWFGVVLMLGFVDTVKRREEDNFYR